MQVPNVTTDSETMMDTYGIYHLARIKADPKTQHLDKGFEAIQNKLRNKMEERKEKWREFQIATASEDYLQIEVDRGIKNLERDILKEVNDNRKHPLYKKYFSKGLRHVTAASTEAEIQRVENILANLGQETAGKLKNGHFSGIKQKLNELKAANQTSSTAQIAYTSAFAEEKSLRLEWRGEYQQENARLLLIFQGDKKMADSFFKKTSKGKKKEKAPAVEPAIEESVKEKADEKAKET